MCACAATCRGDAIGVVFRRRRRARDDQPTREPNGTGGVEGPFGIGEEPAEGLLRGTRNARGGAVPQSLELVRKLGEMGDDLRIESLEERHELLTDAHPLEPDLVVRRIVSDGDTTPFEVQDHVAATRAKERSHDDERGRAIEGPRGRRGEYGESARPGPAKHAEKDGLCPVVGMMRRGDGHGPRHRRSGGERGVARDPGALLHVSARADVDLRTRKWNSTEPRERLRAVELCRCGSAQPMVDAVRDHRDVELGCESGDDVEQRHGVRPAAHGHEEGRAAWDARLSARRERATSMRENRRTRAGRRHGQLIRAGMRADMGQGVHAKTA